ncbi:MAG: hypothetical protein GX128_00715 [Bacteroidales bacterium]|jgi:hypothetical protein|nr:hypothetical protein [Bacteroidales bacterium]
MESGNKLAPITLQLSQILEKKFNRKANFSIEYSPNWLSSVPKMKELAKYLTIIRQVYSSLVDSKYILEKQIELVKRNETQDFDIWFHEPYSFALEFDEFGEDFEKNKFRKQAYYKSTGKIEYDEYCTKKSKPITDETDTVLAEHYGFTEEKLDFIISYDIKHRLGKELEAEDEQ